MKILGVTLDTLRQKAQASPPSTARTVVLSLITAANIQQEIIENYRLHHTYCPQYHSRNVLVRNSSKPCNCGLDNLLKQLENINGPQT